MVSSVRIAIYHLLKKKKNKKFTKRDKDGLNVIIIPRIANGKQIFHSDILVGNFGKPVKALRLLRIFR